MLRLLLLLMLGFFGLQPVGYGYDAPTTLVSGTQNIVDASPETRVPTAVFAASAPLNFHREGGALGRQADTRIFSNFVAEQGIAKPRGTALDAESLKKHVAGEDVDAGVTSWTPDRNEAKKFSGNSGTIIEVPKSKVEDNIVPPPGVSKYTNEQEVLIKGTVQGTPTQP
jgi:hypothetical protein